MPVLKERKCLNCKYEYPSDADNFCPYCGQKNSNLKVGILFFTIVTFAISFSLF